MPYNFKSAEQEGLTREQITSYLASKGRQAEADAYYSSAQVPTRPSLRDDIEKRGEGIVQSLAAGQRGRQSPLRTGLQIAGQAAGFGNDLIARGISKLLPDSAEAALGRGFQSVAQTSPVKRILSAYQGFKQERPALARDLEAVGNLATFGTTGFLGKSTATTAARVPATAKQATTAALDTAKTAVGEAATRLTPLAEKATEKTWRNVLNPTQRMRAQDLKFGKNTPRLLTKEGLLPDVDERGFFDPSENLDIINLKTAAESETLEELLESTGAYGSLDDLRTDAIRSLDVQGSARDKAITHMSREVDAYKRQYRSRGFTDEQGRFKLPLADFNRIKKDLWQKGYTNPLASPEEQTIAGASRTLGRAAKQQIERQADDLGGTEIQNLNKRIGDLEEAAEWLAARRGAPIRNRRIGRYAARLMGGMSGANLGPLGVLGGAITGDIIMEALQKPNWTLGAFKKLIQKAETEAPGAVQAAIERIRINKQMQRSRPQLPPPSPLGSARNPIITPQRAPVIDRGMSEVQRQVRDLEDIFNRLRMQQNQRLLPAPAPGTNAVDIPTPLGSTTASAIDARSNRRAAREFRSRKPPTDAPTPTPQ